MDRRAASFSMQVWLYSNSRSALPPALAGTGMWMLAAAAVWLLDGSPWRWAAVILCFGLGIALLLSSLALVRAARIAFDGKDVLLYIRSGPPQRIPLEFVEVFFLGQGEGAAGDRGEAHGRPLETANVIVRLAERAEPFRHGTTAPSLAHWCDGYITIYGTWCQPLNAEVISALNHALVQAKRQQKSSSTAAGG